MAIILSSSSFLKVALISTVVLSAAVILKLSAPLISEFVVYGFPSIYSNLVSLLRPPYIYLLVNCIIISIVASSKLQAKSSAGDPYLSDTAVDPEPANVSVDVRTEYVGVYDGVDAKVLTGRTVEENAGVYGRREEEEKKDERAGVFYQVKKVTEETMMMVGGDEGMRSVGAPQRSDSMEFPLLNAKEKEKPLVSARFGQRKAVKAIAEGGKALRVSKPKRQDTLESTWKAITEGRSMPLTRHLKKSDTWNTPKDQNSTLHPDPQTMKKSETFNDRTTATKKPSLSPSPGSGRLRREPSLGQDELNRRVEAFINKFNEEMRLQRQESLNQYQAMIKGGAH